MGVWGVRPLLLGRSPLNFPAAPPKRAKSGILLFAAFSAVCRHLCRLLLGGMSDNSAVCRFLCRLAGTPLCRCGAGGGVLWRGRVVACCGGGGAVACLYAPRPQIYRKIEPRIIQTGQVIL